MASGCILSTCFVCGDLVWEDDDWEIAKAPATMGNSSREDLIHARCQGLLSRDPEAVQIILEKEELFKAVIIAKDEMIRQLQEQNKELREILKFRVIQGGQGNGTD